MLAPTNRYAPLCHCEASCKPWQSHAIVDIVKGKTARRPSSVFLLRKNPPSPGGRLSGGQRPPLQNEKNDVIASQCSHWHLKNAWSESDLEFLVHSWQSNVGGGAHDAPFLLSLRGHLCPWQSKENVGAASKPPAIPSPGGRLWWLTFGGKVL